MKRKIINIDEEKCNGCGICVDACAEGAIEIINGKAKLVKDSYCDGLGACIGPCPEGALTFTEREADAFDEEAVKERLREIGRVESAESAHHHQHHAAGGGCPGMAVLNMATRKTDGKKAATGTASELRQWPVQLHLVPPSAPYWQGADLLISADCVAHAYADFHADLLRDHRLIIACPKLDETDNYVAKLTAILQSNEIKSVTVAHMEVPCCTGLVRMVEAALAQCGKDVPYKKVEISVGGEKKS